MSTLEDLNDTSSDEETKEEANFCLMTDTTLEKFESNLDEEINFVDLESLKLAYHELLSNLSILSKAYKNMRKNLKNLSKEHNLRKFIKILVF